MSSRFRELVETRVRYYMTQLFGSTPNIVVEKSNDMQFSIAEYTDMIQQLFGFRKGTSQFWIIVIKVAWVMIFIEKNINIAREIRATHDIKSVINVEETTHE